MPQVLVIRSLLKCVSRCPSLLKLHAYFYGSIKPLLCKRLLSAVLFCSILIPYFRNSDNKNIFDFRTQKLTTYCRFPEIIFVLFRIPKPEKAQFLITIEYHLCPSLPTTHSFHHVPFSAFAPTYILNEYLQRLRMFVGQKSIFSFRTFCC